MKPLKTWPRPAKKNSFTAISDASPGVPSSKKTGGFHLDTCVDASLAAFFFLGDLGIKAEFIAGTMRAIEDDLWIHNGIGGIARYTGDHYHRRSLDDSDVPGNPWLICTLWLAQWKIKQARDGKDLADAKKLLDWALDRATPSGALPEQVHPLTGESTSVCPLVWSHSCLLDTLMAMASKRQEFSAMDLRNLKR